MTAALDVPGAALRPAELLALRDLAPCPAEAARPGDCLLVADFRPSMLWGLIRAFRSVAAAEALALIGWHADLAGGRVGLLALGAGAPLTVPLRAGGMAEVIAGMVSAHDTASALASAGQLDDPPLDRGLAGLAALVPDPAELVIASGFGMPGVGLAARLDLLASRHALRLLHVSDSGHTEEIGAEIAGHAALALDASLPPEAVAGMLAGGFRIG
ncbi:hypothetical protein [Salipiger abyssi]|uniref:hypothetical protein n=1 Tax=Salipiger abyssi TaxID=1250539 RepID=UPI001F42FDAA|nr:hypothetical protein [Salipiger abyssi]